MKRVMVFMFSVFIAILIVQISFVIAEQQTQSSPSEALNPPVAAKVQQITGIVTTLNTTTETITVTKKMRDSVIETILNVDDKTKIMMGSERKTFTDMKVGDPVVVKYTMSDGRNIARSITITPPQAESSEKKMERKK